MFRQILILNIYILIISINAEDTADGLRPKQDISKTKVNGPTSLKLIDDPKCAEDLKRICGNEVHNLNNFAVLECVQSQERDDSALLSEECHHVLWLYKYDLTQSSHIVEMAKGYCKEDIDTFNDCLGNEEAYGNTISCMIQNINKVSQEKCRQYVVRLGTIIFSDYHLVQHVTDSCKADIEKTLCGRIQQASSREPHSQGLTIECLSQHSEKLEPECKTQIFKLSELQSEDFHLDRAFYFACREDRDKFCKSVRAGSGQVYKCLFKHKNDRTMSNDCGEQLSRRQTLIARDFQVSRSLVKACKTAIRENQCKKGAAKDDSELRLPKMLVCLENALRKGKIAEGECKEEILSHRQMLLEISPKIVENCKPEIVEFCNDAKGSAKLHCLIKQYRKKSKVQISKECQRALEDVIKATDPAEDWRVDPILHDACLPVVQNRCQGLRGGQGRVMRCLMRHINSQYMTQSCEAALLEIQYFVARDWKLDPQLYRACRNDSIKFCHAAHDWTVDSPSEPGADTSILVLPCLFRYAYHPTPQLRLSQMCTEEVRRVMHERAAFVQLHPQIEMECLEPLAILCSENTAPGEEMVCLQKNMERLDGNCLSLIKNYTEAEAKDIGLNNLVMSHCSAVMDQLCGGVLQNDEIDEGAMMDCLVHNKNAPAMREHYKCRAVVENFQIIMIKDISFSPKFKQECHDSVRQFCSKATNRKEVLDCLSDRILTDILNEDRSSVSKNCKQQVRKQLTQRHESINLDPDMKRFCQEDIEEYCSSTTGSGAVLECLRVHRSELDSECHEVLFQREKEESLDPSTDVVLTRNCREMIKTFCRDTDSDQLVPCLSKQKDNPDFDMKCRNVLMKRLVERSKDIRLNPGLYKVCKADMTKFCEDQMNLNNHVERNGKVIECLKEILPLKKLTHKCEMKVIQITRVAALNYKLDPVLIEKCNQDMKVLCPSSQMEASEKGEMEECLKLQLEQNKIQDEQCQQHVAEIMQRERADIHADPLLYQSCNLDDTKYCADLERGTHLACLFDLLDRNPNGLEKDCRSKLRQRREMFKAAVKVAKLESVDDIVESVRSSPHRNYFLIILFSAIGVIFLGGLTCGRATRRSYKLMKNR